MWLRGEGQGARPRSLPSTTSTTDDNPNKSGTFLVNGVSALELAAELSSGKCGKGQAAGITAGVGRERLVKEVGSMADTASLVWRGILGRRNSMFEDLWRHQQ